jgi:hypothetical protein
VKEPLELVTVEEKTAADDMFSTGNLFKPI